MRYRRANAAGGTYFFTVNLAERSSDRLVRHVDGLRAVMKRVKEAHPFAILAMVVPRPPARDMALATGRCRLSVALVVDQGRVFAPTGKR